MHTTESIDRLFLELSQFTRATTAKELALAVEVKALRAAMKRFDDLVEATSGRDPLTDDQLKAIQQPYLKRGRAGHLAFARAVERAHGIGA